MISRLAISLKMYPTQLFPVQYTPNRNSTLWVDWVNCYKIRPGTSSLQKWHAIFISASMLLNIWYVVLRLFSLKNIFQFKFGASNTAKKCNREQSWNMLQLIACIKERSSVPEVKIERRAAQYFNNVFQRETAKNVTIFNKKQRICRCLCVQGTRQWWKHNLNDCDIQAFLWHCIENSCSLLSM